MKNNDLEVVEARRSHYDSKTGDNEFECLDYMIDGIPMAEADYDRLLRQPILRHMELTADNRVLDIGCGTGLFLSHYEKLCQRVVGTDISENLLSRYTGSAETYVCAAHDMPFKPNSFDRISMVSVAVLFPSFDYFKTAVQACLNILDDDGILVIGDTTITTQTFNTQYLVLNTHDLVDFLEGLGHPFTIAAQTREKRALSNRKDIVIYKDRTGQA